MRNKTRMNVRKLALGFGCALLFFGLTGESCTPERDVEIVVSVDLVAQLHAEGSDNTYSGTTTVDISDQIDVEEIMDDNGIDSLISLTVQSAFVRTVRKDPAAARTVSGAIDVRRGTGPDYPVVNYTSAAVNSVEYEDWVAIPLEAAGVSLLNDALEDIVAGLGATVAFTTSGTSTPVDVPTDFIWEAKVRLNVVGMKTITIFEPI